MQVDNRQVDETTVLDLVGRLDTTTADGAFSQIEKLANSGSPQVVLNLDKMEYVSSAGLRIILLAAKLFRSIKGEMKICRANGIVKDVLETSGFNHIIDIHDEEESAVASFRTA